MPEPPDPAGQRFQEFKRKMEALTRAYKENTEQQRKLVRMLQAAGFSDPADMERKLKTGAVQAVPQRQDAFAILARHFTQAFSPEDLREMTEDLLDGLTRPRRR